MPDHLHAILHIGGERASTKTASFKTGPIPGSLSHVVRVFKGYACQEIRTSCPQFEWQRGFYDQLIKNQKALSALEQYIRENPEKAKKRSNRKFDLSAQARNTFICMVRPKSTLILFTI